MIIRLLQRDEIPLVRQIDRWEVLGAFKDGKLVGTANGSEERKQKHGH